MVKMGHPLIKMIDFHGHLMVKKIGFHGHPLVKIIGFLGHLFEPGWQPRYLQPAKQYITTTYNYNYTTWRIHELAKTAREDQLCCQNATTKTTPHWWKNKLKFKKFIK